MDRLAGLHHVTAMASDPQGNLDFYTGVLGLRFLKRTVNHDDPGTYHFYFGDAEALPGTLMTFFPWPGAARGVRGAGEASATAFAVPAGAVDGWQARLRGLGVASRVNHRLGERLLTLEDPDGGVIELVESATAGAMPAWKDGVDGSIAIRGFHSATLAVRDASATLELLTGGLGLSTQAREGARTRLRFAGGAGVNGALGQYLDVVEDPTLGRSRLGAGSVHHVALRARDEGEHARVRDVLERRGLGVTGFVDRLYFKSIYFREPGGVLLEIATDGPGFGVDEPMDALGQTLVLPARFESKRALIERRLPAVTVPTVKEPGRSA